MELHLKVIGVLFIVLSLVHWIFPKYFNWPEEFKNVSLMNRQMMYVHSFFIALTVMLMGLICLFCTDELRTTHFGHIIAGGLALFWMVRLVVQLFVYSPQLWKGKKKETGIHILFTFFWIYISVVFLMTTLGY